ncbi:MAG TPA: acetyl-CoA carboxylase, carboxyltransferase subunit beta [Calditrichia bacterium]|nr:acetyl-CoA carboxylase carboxyltransferase subunit beta [Calditrichota bacterium]HQU73237.1 acetyl-CoA carboxylase, carboxyltransferase subunit beta [Calditrichia bacterium]HQV30737.1 acetyl-CoA carboxylase, carboxyltransferase subunit beta [Calditrichia bacterium]
MDWFKRRKGIATSEKKAIPDGLWVKCNSCGEIIYRPELQKRLFVCPKCEYHFRINSKDYVEYFFDPDSFTETGANIKPADPLRFRDTKKYTDRLKAAQKTTGLNDAAITGDATIEGKPVVCAIMDFTFIGGSMGSVVGEKIARAADRARERRVPLIVISASGGARMMESALSLMQMAKTSAKLAQLAQEGIPYFSILTDPTTGGTTASFAMLGDVNIAEPGALIGFAGQRVIKQTIGQDLPEGFQKAEFLKDHGFVDLIVHRWEMRETLGKIIDLLWAGGGKAKNNGKVASGEKAAKASRSSDAVAPGKN